MGTCPYGSVYDAGLCYPQCKSGFSGIGPICYGDCPPNTSNTLDVCIKHSYTRGVGTIPDCNPTTEYENGALCYPNCKPDFKGDGPVCWGVCPSGFKNYDGFCGKPNTDYGRGTGYRSEAACVEDNKHNAGINGCEYYYGLWYPKCDKGFHNYDCCVCTPDCPPGFSDDGATCYKPSYPNGAGRIPNDCPSGKELFEGLCYLPCKPGYSGFYASCFAECSGNTKDTGTQCQKDEYGRGVGTIPGLSTVTWVIIIGIVAIIIIFIVAALITSVRRAEKAPIVIPA